MRGMRGIEARAVGARTTNGRALPPVGRCRGGRYRRRGWPVWPARPTVVRYRRWVGAAGRGGGTAAAGGRCRPHDQRSCATADGSIPPGVRAVPPLRVAGVARTTNGRALPPVGRYRRAWGRYRRCGWPVWPARPTVVRYRVGAGGGRAPRALQTSPPGRSRPLVVTRPMRQSRFARPTFDASSFSSGPGRSDRAPGAR